jgi:hypothetical protein
VFLIPVALLAGLAVALVAGPELRERRESLVRDRFAWALLAHVGTLLVPLALYLYAVAPDWAMLYLVEQARFGPLRACPTLAVALVSLALATYGWTRRPSAHRNWRFFVAAFGVVTVSVLAGAILTRHRWLVVGSHAAFRAGRAEPLGSTRLAVALPVVLLAASAGAALLSLQLHRFARRILR